MDEARRPQAARRQAEEEWLKRFLIADEAESRRLHQELNEISYREIVDRVLPRKARAVTSAKSLDVLPEQAHAPRPARISHRRRSWESRTRRFSFTLRASWKGPATVRPRGRRGTRGRADRLAAANDMTPYLSPDDLAVMPRLRRTEANGLRLSMLRRCDS